MNRAKIFLISPDKRALTPMTETAYATEDDLQKYLAHYPDLLPRDQIDPENPRRWLLVSREMGVPREEGGIDHWSLDHLFLDQDGVPTFVECKRSSDTRSRREVVAQMLDYAANGLAYWSLDQIRQAAAETAAAEKLSLDEKVQTLLDPEATGPSMTIEAFWQTIEANLQNGKVRLIFVADTISKELRRLVEFLNDKMKDVEVLAVEMKQFLGQERQTVLVPRAVGITEASRQQKVSSRTQTNRQQFLGNFDASPRAKRFFEKVLDTAEAGGHLISWGEKGFSVRASQPDNNKLTSFIYGWPGGTFEIYLGYLPETEREPLRQQLLRIGPLKAGGKGVSLRTLVTELTDLGPLEQSLEFIMRMIDEILKSNAEAKQER